MGVSMYIDFSMSKDDLPDYNKYKEVLFVMKKQTPKEISWPDDIGVEAESMAVARVDPWPKQTLYVFATQRFGYDLESLFEDVDAAGIIDRLLEANRKPMEFWPGSNLPKDETYSLEPVDDGTTLKEILAVLEDIHSILCEPDV